MDKQQKKQIRKYIRFGIIVLVVALLSVMPLLASKTAVADGPQASILQTTAQGRSIKTQLIGGGQLSSNNTEEVTIPAEVKLKEYLVGNGDIVKKGDAIAVVDKVSVLSALAEVQQTLDYLSGQLSNASTTADSDSVLAHAGGLVKTIYGKQGDSVRDVMLRHGALAVISLDGRMAVDLECSTDLKAGSTVCVFLADSTEVEGKVESAAGGKLVISVADDGYAAGENVTVKTKDGTLLGSGSLYIHHAWNATAYYGTISKVNAAEGDTLSAGKTLFELDAGNYSAEFQILNAERQKYEALMQELFLMYDSGTVCAPCDGIVTGTDDDAAFLLAAREQPWYAELLSTVTPQPSYSVILLSSDTGSIPSEPAPSDPTVPTDPSEPPDIPEDPEAPVYTVTVGQVKEDGSIDIGYTYANITDLNMVPTTFTSTGTVDTWPLTDLVNRDLTPYSGTAAAGNLLFKVMPSQGAVFYVFAAIAPSGGQQFPGGNMGGMVDFGGMMGGMGGSIPTFEPYTLETLTIASVTSQEEMSLEITLDEQDISKVEIGQKAVITIEALTGQSFSATVTSISNTGTNEGGSSKFTAKLTLDKSGEMLPGMHACAYLTLETAENVLTIPTAALVEDGAKTLVYTDCREKDGTLINPVEVTTGISDGEYVQILSGLEEGTSIWYAYYDTLPVSNVPEPALPF